MNHSNEFFQIPGDLPNRSWLLEQFAKAGISPILREEIMADCDNHYHNLLNHAPISIWDEDFSLVKQRLDQLRVDGVVDLEPFLNKNPLLVQELASLIRVIFINHTGLAFYGATSIKDFQAGIQMIFGSHIQNFLLPEFLAIWNMQTDYSGEGTNFSLDGKPLAVSVRWRVFPGCEETYNHVLVTVQDITKQEEIRKALKASEERYQAVSEITSDFAFSISRLPSGEYQFDWATESFTELTGYTIQEVIQGNSMELFTHPDDRSIIHEAGLKVMQGETVSAELRFITKNKQTRWVRSFLRTIQSSMSPDRIQIVGAVQDITQRKLAEIALFETQQQLELRIQELERRSREIQLLTQMANNLQLCHSTNEAYQIAAETAHLLFPQLTGALYLSGGDGQSFQLVASWGLPPKNLSFNRQECWALRRAGPFHSHGKPRTLICSHVRPASETNSSLCMPILQSEKIIGLFSLESEVNQPEIDQNAHSILSAMSEQFGLAISNLNLRESLSEQAVHDPLTGLYNRYYMEEFLEKEIHRARRSNKPVSVIMIDMDHFRDLNALFGHPNVDVALSEVGQLLVQSVRAGDIACRYGGDEFLLIMPEATLDVARERAIGLCQAVHSLSVRSETRPPQPISFSVGIACFPRHGKTVTELLRTADAAVFSAKDRGRDRVELAP